MMKTELPPRTSSFRSVSAVLAAAKPGWNSLVWLLAIAGILLVLSNTRWGAYLSDDTYYYIYPARDLAAGNGFQPSYIFAPLFPLVLAVLNVLGIEALTAARWVNALLFGVNLWLTARITTRLGVPRPFAVLAAALVLLADVVIEAHGWAMSEALAFTFMLLCLDFTLAFLGSGSRRYWWFAAAAAALTLLTRYAALPLVAGVSLALLLFAPSRKLLNRLKEAVLFGAVSLAPLAVYLLRNQMTSGHPVRYQQFFNVPFTRDQLNWFLYHWLSLFVPGRLLRGRELLAGLLAGLVVAAVLLILAWFYRKKWREPGERLFVIGITLLAAVIAANLAMLYLARGLTELDVFNPRYLVPLLIITLMLMAGLAGRLWQAAGQPVRYAVLAVFAVFLLYYGYRTFDFSRQVMRTGLGYSNVGWHNSETVAYIRQHPELTRLVSTGEMGVYFWTGRMPRVVSDFPNPQARKAYLCESGASLFIMDQMPVEIYGLSLEEAVSGLQLAQDFNDSDMYRCPTGN